jgi:hypothetical protein
VIEDTELGEFGEGQRLNPRAQVAVTLVLVRTLEEAFAMG